MPVADQVKSLAEDIQVSHGAREVTVSDIIKETQQTLGNFQHERVENTRNLRRTLAENRRELAERTRALVEKTRELNRTRAAEVRQTRAENSQSIQQQAHETEQFLTQAEEERKEDFHTLISEIKNTIETIEKETEETLSNFDHEHREMTEQLRKDVHETVSSLIADFSTDRHQSLNNWAVLARGRVAPQAQAQAQTKPGRRA